jgi:non-ribosomal peptide synthetase component F
MAAHRARAATDADSARIARFNRTETTFPDNVTLQELVEAQIDRHSSETAVICDHDKVFGVPSLTYAQFNDKVNQLAHLLRAQGVRPGDIVALTVERSFAMTIGILGNYFEKIDEMLLAPSGKADRKALPKPSPSGKS